MGCDIHLYLESKCNEKWVDDNYWKVNSYTDEEREWDVEQFYHGRNYWLFATLADVRNNDSFPYIDTPRGLPKDVSKLIKEESDNYGCDGHSHSWVTLKELMEWEKKTLVVDVKGMISPQQYKDLQKGISPESWCSSTSQSDHVETTWKMINNSLTPFLDALKERIKKEKWYFNEQSLEEYLENSKESYRVVFWFDN